MSRILLVDDAPSSREVVATLLRRHGHETSTARNGADALAQIKQQKPDLVLLDHMMPEVDGLTFLASIRRFPKWRDLPVIMFTGVSDRKCESQAQSLGVRAYLQKANFTMQQLIESIESHLRPTAA